MRTARLLPVLGILAGGMLTGGAAAAPSASAGAAIIPIQPGEGFRGLVNGVRDGATIKVVCPGPGYPGQTGRPLAGQTLILGFTGYSPTGVPGGATGSAATSITAALPGPSTGTPIVFKDYNVPQPIPASASLPCYGKHDIWFVPTPMSDTAVPDKVTVTFVNVAV